MKASVEWWHQRFTAIFIALFLAISFGLVALFHKTIKFATGMQFFIKSPFYTAMAIMLFFAIMYHGAIGMKIVIEDYISKPILRRTTISLLFLFTYFVIITVSICLLTAHINLNIIK